MIRYIVLIVFILFVVIDFVNRIDRTDCIDRIDSRVLNCSALQLKDNPNDPTKSGMTSWGKKGKLF